MAIGGNPGANIQDASQRDGDSAFRYEGFSGMGNTVSSLLHSASRRRFPLVATTGGTTALIAACNPAIESASSFQGTDITGAQWGRGFELNDHSGQARILADFKGKVMACALLPLACGLVLRARAICADACFDCSVFPTGSGDRARVARTGKGVSHFNARAQ